ncbi:MAG TPA: SDR family NAD(P)-dependent oxidoreductase [Steroidobacteraceae bacterium]
MNATPALTLLSRRFPAKRVFITGAGSGLGRALALEFAAAGWQLGIADISAERLVSVAAELRAGGAASVSTHAGDVAAEPFVTQALDEFVAACGGIDVLINNAGVAVAGAVDATPVADWRWIVDINLLGVVWGCRAALPAMRRQGSGLILNIASSAGYASAPSMAPYNMTKAAVISLSETLAAELDTAGIHVSCAMPGFFRTHLLDSMRAPAEENAMAHQLMDHSGHDPVEAARAILAATARGKLYVIWPREYRLLWRLKRWFPHWYLGRVRGFRDAQLRRAASRPPG